LYSAAVTCKDHGDSFMCYDIYAVIMSCIFCDMQ